MFAYITRELRLKKELRRRLGGLKKLLSLRLGELIKELRRRIGGLLCCLSGGEHVHYHKVERLVQ